MEGTSWHNPILTQSRLQGMASRWVLSISTEGDSTFLGSLFQCFVTLNNILMNNSNFLLCTMTIISGKLMNLTKFKPYLPQFSWKPSRYVVVNMVSKNHFHSTDTIMVVLNHWSTVSTTVHNDGESYFSLAAGPK